MTPGNSDPTGNRFEAPPMDHASSVRCAGFRCLAYRDAARHWRNFFSHELLPGSVEELSAAGATPAVAV
jgi:hypothetical protein